MQRLHSNQTGTIKTINYQKRQQIENCQLYKIQSFTDANIEDLIACWDSGPLAGITGYLLNSYSDSISVALS